jgi:hypothetical protein
MRTSLILPVVVLPIAALLALSACGSSDDEATDAAGGGDIAVSEDGPMPQPGQYRTTAELVEFNMPSAPPEAAQIMQQAFSQGAMEANSYCLTPEQASTSREDMLKSMAESNCTVDTFTMAGGRINATLSCPTGQGVSGQVTMAGTMNESGSDIEMSFTTQVPDMGDATIRMRMKSERVGECS